MADHRLIVAGGFRIAGWVLGLPSSLAALGLGAGALTAGAGSAAPKGEALSISTYGIAGLLSNAASGVVGVLAFLNGLAAWVFGLLAVLALVVALFAGLLYLIGRGLRASATWARVLAVALTILSSLIGLIALTFLSGGAQLVDAGLLAALLYVLWVLGWRFGDQAAPGPNSRRRNAAP